MIVLLSHAELEPTTEAVMDWLAHFGAPHLRLNGEDLTAGALRLALGDDGPRLHLEGESFGGAALAFDPQAVRVVWFRRWAHAHGLASAEPFREPGGMPHPAHQYHRLAHQVDAELERLSTFVFELLDGADWLPRPERMVPNKLSVLRAAREAGLSTPATLVTNDRTALRLFADAHGALITKPLGDGTWIDAGGHSYSLFTALVTRADVDALPETFFPSLFQEQLPKAYEVRVFYLDGDCHSMAIFSPHSRHAAVDFRRVDPERPNRYVPYRLPEALAEQVARLMQALSLETGSLDFVRTPDGRHVFLEVNPVGQFGMVSEPCNYHLERRVAEHLIRRMTHAAA